MKTTLPLGATPLASQVGEEVLIDQISPVLEDTLACVVERINPTPGRIFVAPGAAVAWDQCDCDGQVWTRLASIRPVLLTSPRPVGCQVMGWDLVIEIGVLRCAAVVDSNGNPPTAQAVTADAYQQVLDAQAVMAALECCVEPHVLQTPAYTPAGPQGGCVGGTWTFTKRIDACGCSDHVAALAPEG